MAEYIERGALMVALCEEIIGDGDYYNGKDDMQDQIRDMVSRFPSADVAPVRHGRWEKHESVSCILGCSVCRDVYIYEPWVTDGKWNYCPNCGCKMLEDLDGEK